MNRHSKGVALTVGASLIWGTSFVAISVGLQFADPYLLLFERFLVASLVILVLGVFMRPARVWPEIRKGRTWVLAGVYAASFLLQFIGQDASGASASALLSDLFVVFVPVAAYFVLREDLPNSSKMAVALSVSGMALVFPSGFNVAGSVIGDLILVGSALGYTVFIVLGKKYQITTLASSFAVIVSMTVLLAPLAALAGWPFSPGRLMAPGDWESVLWLGVPCTVIALAMYTRGLASIRAAQSATLLLLEIMVGVALSVSLLDEVLTTTQVLGALVIASAVLLSARQ